MAKYRLRITQFCALSHDTQFQTWLQSNFHDLYEELIMHLSTSNSCTANKQKMVAIQLEIRKRGKADRLMDFLLREFPLVVEVLEEKTTKPVTEEIERPGIFNHYNPHLLTFPQKLILRNKDQSILVKSVDDFIKDKIDPDYLIIGDIAYIEYFKLKYVKEAKIIPTDARELVVYRRKNGIAQSQKIVEEGQR